MLRMMKATIVAILSYALVIGSAVAQVAPQNSVYTGPASGAGQATFKTASTWFDNLCNSTVGQIWVRATGAWGCSSLGYYNPAWYANINAAVTAIGSTQTTLRISDAETLTASLTIPSTLTLQVVAGGSIVKASTYTLTINGPFLAPLAQAFSGFSAGDVTFANGAAYEFPVDWWGASAAASAATNRVAFNSAVQASWGRGKVTVGSGTFSLCGTGAQSASNGAAIINNQAINTGLAPTYIKGSGRSLTVLQASASCNYNVLESVNTANTQIELPVTLEELTIDGNGANQTQQAAGDRYQNGAYFQNSGPIVLNKVSFTGGSYHGFNANAVTDLTMNAVRTHNNCSDGVVFNGNVGAGLYGLRAIGDLETFNNGRSDCGTKLDFINMGAVVFEQIGANLRITSSGHTTHQAPNGANPYSGGGLVTSYLFDSKIDLTSNGDRTAWYPDALTQNNKLTIMCRNAANYCVDDTNGTVGAASAVAGNTIVANFSQSALSFHLGAATGLWSRNTISGYALDTTAGGITQIFVLGPNYTGTNIVTNFTAGNVLTSSTLDNMFKFSSATAGSANYYNNIYVVGTFTGSIFNGQDSSDVICGVKGYATEAAACATFLNLGAGVGAWTGLTSFTSGGVPYFNSTSAVGTSALLTQYGPIYGGGAANPPVSMAAGTNGQLIVGQTGAAPLWKTITGDVTFTAAGASAIGSTKVTSAMLNADVFSTAHTWGTNSQIFSAPPVMQNTGEAMRLEGTNGFLSFYTTNSGARTGYIQGGSGQITMAGDSTNNFVFNVGGSDRWRFDNLGKLVSLGATNTIVLKQGSNGSTGTFVCTSGGSINVANTFATTADVIAISLQVAGGTISTPPAVSVPPNGTQFTVKCATSDTGTYGYAITRTAP